MEIIQDFFPINRFSRPGNKRKQTNAVAGHYVGNPGTSAENNHNYFKNLKDQKTYIGDDNKTYLLDKNGGKTKTKATFASSHYVIGLEGEIIQGIPEDEESYCTNQRNFDTISIEACHPKSDGQFTAATYASFVWLVADIMKRHSLTLPNGLIRHYDVTKKICPKWFVDYPEEYEKFKANVQKTLDGGTPNINPDRPAPWAKDAWEKMKAMGIFDGTRPMDDISRQEIAAVMLRIINTLDIAMPIKNPQAELTMPDTWAIEEWSTAYTIGLIDGTNAKADITRQEMAIIILRMLERSAASETIPKVSTLVKADFTKLGLNEPATWAYVPWMQVYQLKLMDGTRPTESITRQEMAVVISRIFELLD